MLIDELSCDALAGDHPEWIQGNTADRKKRNSVGGKLANQVSSKHSLSSCPAERLEWIDRSDPSGASEERQSYIKAVSNTIRPGMSKILFLATKSPWPAIDGGRLLVSSTLRELTARGHQVTLVAPSLAPPPAEEVPDGCRFRLVDARPRPMLLALMLSRLQGRALSTARHALAPVRREVARLVDTESFDLVHVEQLQALAQAEPVFKGVAGLPVVLRAQNVESDLWAGTAVSASTGSHRFFGMIAAREARRLARDEGRAVVRADATVALTSEDAGRLRELAGGRGRLHVVRVPFAPELPPAEKTLDGKPALVMLGSEGWLPNRDAADWFRTSIWPAVRAVLPEARLHVFGNISLGQSGQDSSSGVHGYPPPKSSREVFAPGSVMVVPLRIGSGVRMKILEAWARGVPVVGTPQAVRGLEAEDGEDLLVAETTEDFVDAFRRLHENPDLAVRLIRGGRASLARRHDPARVTGDLIEVYEQLLPSS